MILLNKEQAKNVIRANKGKHYTYGLCKRDGELFYVGIGQRNRLFVHETDTRRGYVYNKLKSSIISKEEYLLYVLFIVSSNRDSCLKMEANVISRFGRRDIGTGTLSNLTDGGDPGPNGCVYSEERRIKHSESLKKSASKIAKTLKDRYNSLSEEEQKEISSRLDGHRNNEKARKKISEKTKARWADLEYREKLRAKLAIINSELSEVHSENMKRLWSDPDFREKMLEARRLARQKKLAAKELADNNVVNKIE